jgi:acyl carrier protein
MDDISATLRQFVATNFYVPDPSELTDDASLLDRGIIDSTGVLELIGFLEDTFGVKVEDAEMVPENLDSIGRITAYIQRKNENKKA